MREQPPRADEQEKPPGAERKLFAEEFVAQEARALDEVVPPWRGAEIEARESTPSFRLRNRRTKKALLVALTLMTTFGPFFTQEAHAEGPGGEAAARVLLMENNKLRITPERHSADSPETDPKLIALNAEKTDQLRKTIESKEVTDTIAYLRSVYGSTIDNFLGEIELEKYFLAKEKQAPTAEEKSEWEVLVAGDQDLFWDKEKMAQRNEAIGKYPRVDGFDKLSGYSNATIEALLKTVPRGLVNHVDEIRYIDAQESRVNYDVGGTAETVGLSGVLWNGEGDIVTQYDEPALHGEGANEEIQRVFYHEVLGHENDWESAGSRTMLERLQMLKDITQWLADPHRPRSEYIDVTVPEEYRRNGWDLQEMEYRQAQELWAQSVEHSRHPLSALFARSGGAETTTLTDKASQPRVHPALSLTESGVILPTVAGASEHVLTSNPTEYALVYKWLIEHGPKK